MEVFSITGQRATGPVPFSVTTVAERQTPPITTRSGLQIVPYYTFATSIQADILLIPGGRGARHERENPAMLDFIRTQAQETEIVMSICTGALLLAATGLLNELQATTHHAALKELAGIEPGCTVQEGVRFVDNGPVITSAGISAGIDAALYVVQRLLGASVARETAEHMEYNWLPDTAAQ